MRYLSILLLLFVTISCQKKEPKGNQSEKDKTIITQYIADNNLNAESTSSGLYYVIDTLGTGAQPSSSSSVTVVYKGYLADSTVFDQSSSTGATFGLNSVIKGWKEGIPKFKAGGSGILLIPSSLGYGTDERPSIPANSVLIFDIKLLNVR